MTRFLLVHLPWLERLEKPDNVVFFDKLLITKHILWAKFEASMFMGCVQLNVHMSSSLGHNVPSSNARSWVTVFDEKSGMAKMKATFVFVQVRCVHSNNTCICLQPLANLCIVPSCYGYGEELSVSSFLGPHRNPPLDKLMEGYLQSCLLSEQPLLGNSDCVNALERLEGWTMGNFFPVRPQNSMCICLSTRVSHTWNMKYWLRSRQSGLFSASSLFV